MLRKFCLAVYRGFFWTYERGSWQYDVMVILILVFIFATPRQWFHDQPLQMAAPPSDVVLLQDDPTQQLYQLRAGLIDNETADALHQSVQRVLRRFTGRPVEITRIEPAVDSSGQVVSYAVWVR